MRIDPDRPGFASRPHGRKAKQPPFARQVRAHIQAGHPVPEVHLFHGPAAFERARRRRGGLALPAGVDPLALDWAITAGREVLILPAADAHARRPVEIPESKIRRLALALLRAGALVVRSVDPAGDLAVFRPDEDRRGAFGDAAA